MRSKLLLLAMIACSAIVALLSSAQPWVFIELSAGAAAFEQLSLTGQELHPALAPVAIAALAAALALTIAGVVFRRVLGVLVAGLGVALALAVCGVWSDPVAAARGHLDEVTGITGTEQAALVAGSETSSLILVALVAGALMCVSGVMVSVLSGGWKSAGRKYDAASPASVRDDGPPDRISDWESLSDGFDPSDGVNPNDDETKHSRDFPAAPAVDSTSSDRTE
ncbi:MAG: Trp biosynthesis-associated membrane protein [Microbacteriaceae bacterium]|nr:Trp biosynthesis-associated membrane protein [Microbacteriaceae bacterium]